MLRRRTAILAAATLLLPAVMSAPMASGQAPESAASSPAGALSEALMAACRQNGAEFARHLTADNAAAFRALAADTRTALMKRFVLLQAPGRPLLSSDAQGRTVIHCETLGVTAETRFGDTRLRENLAFIPVEVRASGDSAESGRNSRRVEFGLVREGGGWKLLSVGLLLLDLPALARQWEEADLEASETAAIAALREIAKAIETYRRAFGRMPGSLAELGPAPKEGISPAAAGLLDAELATGKKGGYTFRYLILSDSGETHGLRFELAAVPLKYGKTGRRSFFLDGSGALRGQDKKGAVATASDPQIEPR